MQVVVGDAAAPDKRQEELFRELAELEQKHVSPQRKSFLDKLKTSLPASQTTPEARKPPGRARLASSLHSASLIKTQAVHRP